ncbi:iron-sulfur cluster biosynthesis family protein [Bacillus testis]|uniref:iron-sulfur cluster biosynthesis family protein n=1 Tax=Bacillus testis TaxID=1622072 RepID=UPI00067F44DA|nr:iron-sulfur cluster biosynthesis family protein [Bacillus testis]
MNITDQAKGYIQQAMKDSDVSTLRFYGIAGCCGVNLGVALQEAEEKDSVEEINGIKVAIHPDVKDQLNGVTVDVEEENGEMGIVLNGYDANSCC